VRSKTYVAESLMIDPQKKLATVPCCIDIHNSASSLTVSASNPPGSGAQRIKIIIKATATKGSPAQPGPPPPAQAGLLTGGALPPIPQQQSCALGVVIFLDGVKQPENRLWTTDELAANPIMIDVSGVNQTSISLGWGPAPTAALFDYYVKDSTAMFNGDQGWYGGGSLDCNATLSVQMLDQ
jgi:hypothetical protein